MVKRRRRLLLIFLVFFLLGLLGLFIRKIRIEKEDKLEPVDEFDTCYKLTGYWDHEDYVTGKRDACYFDLGIDNKKIEYCLRIYSYSDLNYRCLASVAAQKNDEEICNLINQSYKRQITLCKDKVKKINN